MARHWLIDVALRAGLANADALDTPARAPVAEIWAALTEASGVDDAELVRHVADHFKLQIAELAAGEVKAVKLVPEAVARRFHVFPLREDDRALVVATSDPTDMEVEQALGFASGRTPVFEVAAPAALLEAIDARYSPDRVMEDLLGRVDSDLLDHVSLVEEEQAEAIAAHELDAAPVVKLTNLILREAVEQGASDIHIEPGRTGGLVRFRVDGVLRHYMPMPMPALSRVVSRIKILAKLDIADRLRPQDGRARMRVAEHAYDLRVSTVPTRDAEKAVIRILNPDDSITLDELGVTTPERSRFRRLLSYREGITLVTGPTGSGKTTTLYAALRELATGEVNIMTVEDPVEYELPGTTQIQVEPRQRMTFASALRAALRQDPDVILVGEIRDLETAEVAVQASQTGHLVLATLHTNDAVGVVARLRDLGLDRGSVVESLRGAVAQRLVRRVCRDCAGSIEGGTLTDHERQLAERFRMQPTVRAVGCSKCGGSGYRGRAPVIEVATAGPHLQAAIHAGASHLELQQAALDDGMRPMREVALDLVQEGVTTLAEVERALGEAAEAPEPLDERPHILLVDDDAVIRTMARSLLEKSYRISEANDGSAALDVLQGGAPYDLMVLDLNMPKLDGYEVLRRVRDSVTTAGMPVVVLTGAEEGDAEVRVMEEGADDYIRKPIDPPRFVARIKAALRRAGA